MWVHEPLLVFPGYAAGARHAHTISCLFPLPPYSLTIIAVATAVLLWGHHRAQRGLWLGKPKISSDLLFKLLIGGYTSQPPPLKWHYRQGPVLCWKFPANSCCCCLLNWQRYLRSEELHVLLVNWYACCTKRYSRRCTRKVGQHHCTG